MTWTLTDAKLPGPSRLAHLIVSQEQGRVTLHLCLWTELCEAWIPHWEQRQLLIFELFHTEVVLLGFQKIFRVKHYGGRQLARRLNQGKVFANEQDDLDSIHSIHVMERKN